MIFTTKGTKRTKVRPEDGLGFVCFVPFVVNL
jgi:hypothetical protein